MRLGIVGSRTFNDYSLLEKALNKLANRIDIKTIVSGGARGADSLAIKYAEVNNIETIVFKPDWSIGKAAAAIRNRKIVDNIDILIAFWDGTSKGTRMTIDMAKSKNIKVLKIIYTEIL